MQYSLHWLTAQLLLTLQAVFIHCSKPLWNQRPSNVETKTETKTNFSKPKPKCLNQKLKPRILKMSKLKQKPPKLSKPKPRFHSSLTSFPDNQTISCLVSRERLLCVSEPFSAKSGQRNTYKRNYGYFENVKRSLQSTQNLSDNYLQKSPTLGSSPPLCHSSQMNTHLVQQKSEDSKGLR